jgi:hypothetical protein
VRVEEHRELQRRIRFRARENEVSAFLIVASARFRFVNYFCNFNAYFLFLSFFLLLLSGNETKRNETRERKAVDKLEVTFKRPDNPKKKKKRMAVKEVALKVVAKKAKKPAAASKKKKGAAERKNAKVAKAKPAGAATKKAATKPRTPKAKNPAKAKKKLSKNELISETTVAEKKMISKVAAENKEN